MGLVHFIIFNQILTDCGLVAPPFSTCRCVTIALLPIFRGVGSTKGVALSRDLFFWECSAPSAIRNPGERKAAAKSDTKIDPSMSELEYFTDGMLPYG
jgi:hypothetical protein